MFKPRVVLTNKKTVAKVPTDKINHDPPCETYSKTTGLTDSESVKESDFVNGSPKKICDAQPYSREHPSDSQQDMGVTSHSLSNTIATSLISPSSCSSSINENKSSPIRISLEFASLNSLKTEPKHQPLTSPPVHYIKKLKRKINVSILKSHIAYNSHINSISYNTLDITPCKYWRDVMNSFAHMIFIVSAGMFRFS